MDFQNTFIFSWSINDWIQNCLVSPMFYGCNTKFLLNEDCSDYNVIDLNRKLWTYMYIYRSVYMHTQKQFLIQNIWDQIYIRIGYFSIFFLILKPQHALYGIIPSVLPGAVSCIHITKATTFMLRFAAKCIMTFCTFWI